MATNTLGEDRAGNEIGELSQTAARLDLNDGTDSQTDKTLSTTISVGDSSTTESSTLREYVEGQRGIDREDTSDWLLDVLIDRKHLQVSYELSGSRVCTS